MNDKNWVRSSYLVLRRMARRVVKGNRWFDLHLGRHLVRVDLILRRLGVLSHVGDSGVIRHCGLDICFLPEDSEIIRSLIANGEYEAETCRAIKEYLRLGGGFVDLGAHIGFMTLLGARVVGADGRVYSFEPSPHTRETLLKNVSLNGFGDRVTVEPFAVSSGRSRRIFVVSAASQSSRLKLDAEAVPGEEVEVETTSLDEYFRGRGWPRIDVVKMDIEGAELSAIQGMTELVRRNPSMAVIFEYNRNQVRRTGTDPVELVRLLRSLGFQRFTILFREARVIDLPDELPALEKLARRANVNVLAEPGSARGWSEGGAGE